MSVQAPPPRRPPRPRPIDAAWPALPLAALGIAVLVALLAVLLAPERSVEDQVRDDVDALAQAVQQGRGEDACARLASPLREVVLARTAPLACPAAIRTFGLGIDAEALRRGDIAEVTVVGDQARVLRQDIRFPGGQVFSNGLQLLRVDGTWRLALLTA